MLQRRKIPKSRIRHTAPKLCGLYIQYMCTAFPNESIEALSFRLTHVLHLLHHHTSEWFWCVDNKNNKPPRLFSLIAILVSLDEVNKKMYPEFCRGPLLAKQSLDELQSTMLNSLSEKQVVRMYTSSSKCLMTSFL